MATPLKLKYYYEEPDPGIPYAHLILPAKPEVICFPNGWSVSVPAASAAHSEIWFTHMCLEDVLHLVKHYGADFDGPIVDRSQGFDWAISAYESDPNLGIQTHYMVSTDDVSLDPFDPTCLAVGSTVQFPSSNWAVDLDHEWIRSPISEGGIPAQRLRDLLDVDIVTTSPYDGESLVYDATRMMWISKSVGIEVASNMPTASKPKQVILYIGPNTTDYMHNAIYVSLSNDPLPGFHWEMVGSIGVRQVTEYEAPVLLHELIQYIGEDDYTDPDHPLIQDCLYICTADEDGNLYWKPDRVFRLDHLEDVDIDEDTLKQGDILIYKAPDPTDPTSEGMWINVESNHIEQLKLLEDSVFTLDADHVGYRAYLINDIIDPTTSTVVNKKGYYEIQESETTAGTYEWVYVNDVCPVFDIDTTTIQTGFINDICDIEKIQSGCCIRETHDTDTYLYNLVQNFNDQYIYVYNDPSKLPKVDKRVITIDTTLGTWVLTTKPAVTEYFQVESFDALEPPSAKTAGLRCYLTKDIINPVSGLVIRDKGAYVVEEVGVGLFDWVPVSETQIWERFTRGTDTFSFIEPVDGKVKGLTIWGPTTDDDLTITTNGTAHTIHPLTQLSIAELKEGEKIHVDIDGTGYLLQEDGTETPLSSDQIAYLTGFPTSHYGSTVTYSTEVGFWYDSYRHYEAIPFIGDVELTEDIEDGDVLVFDKFSEQWVNGMVNLDFPEVWELPEDYLVEEKEGFRVYLVKPWTDPATSAGYEPAWYQCTHNEDDDTYFWKKVENPNNSMEQLLHLEDSVYNPSEEFNGFRCYLVRDYTDGAGNTVKRGMYEIQEDATFPGHYKWARIPWEVLDVPTVGPADNVEGWCHRYSNIVMFYFHYHQVGDPTADPTIPGVTTVDVAYGMPKPVKEQNFDVALNKVGGISTMAHLDLEGNLTLTDTEGEYSFTVWGCYFSEDLHSESDWVAGSTIGIENIYECLDTDYDPLSLEDGYMLIYDGKVKNKWVAKKGPSTFDGLEDTEFTDEYLANGTLVRYQDGAWRPIAPSNTPNDTLIINDDGTEQWVHPSEMAEYEGNGIKVEHLEDTVITDATLENGQVLTYQAPDPTDPTSVGKWINKAAGGIPSGAMLWYLGANAPDGWFLCRGQTFDTTLYPELADVINYRYGGSGTTAYLPTLDYVIIKHD